MNTTHTPGPWTATLSGDVRIDDRVTGANGAPVLRGSITNTADAALIAAAPELLAALVEVTDRLTVFSTSANLNTGLALEAARAAIARATPEA